MTDTAETMLKNALYDVAAALDILRGGLEPAGDYCPERHIDMKLENALHWLTATLAHEGLEVPR